MRAQNLQNSSKICIAKLLKHVEKCSNVLPVYQYLLPIAAHLAEIAHMCRYYQSPTLTELFLPILIAKGKLFINNTNIKKVLNYWSKGHLKNNVASMTHLKVDDIEGKQYFNFLPFLGHLTRLQYLEIGSLVDDDLMVILGINCPELVVFDARDEVTNAITDVGLSYLVQCKKLRRIYFSFSDEYDCSMEQPSYSEKGIALLMLSLPELEFVQCSEYLLRDALCFIYQSSYHKRKLPLRCMLLDHPEVNAHTIKIVPILCPQLEVLSLDADSDNEGLIGLTIRYLPMLKILLLTLSSGFKFSSLSISSYGAQLAYLQITTSLLDSQDILMLSQSCVNLKTLVLKMYSFGYDGMSAKSLKCSLFPSVERLELQQSISVRLFSFLCLGIENLVEVHCPWATIHGLEEALTSMVSYGGWKNVETLVLPAMSHISLPVVQMIVAALPSLSYMGISVNLAEENAVNSYIQRYFPHITRKDQELMPSPSKTGIFSPTSWSGEMQTEFINI